MMTQLGTFSNAMLSCNSITACSLLLQHQQGSCLRPDQSVLGLTVLTPLTAWYVAVRLVQFVSGTSHTCTALLILHADADAFSHNVMQTAVAEV